MPLLPTDPKKRNLLMLGVAPVALLGAYWYFYYGPRSEKLDLQEKRLEQLTTKNTAAKAEVARSGPDLKKKLALYEQHADRLEQLIPKTAEVPDLLHDVTLRAEETGVELNLMRPESNEAAGPYTQQVYSMSVFGPFDGIGRFLTAVGSLPRIITPVHLKLVPRTETDRSGAQRLQAEFQIETYVTEAPPPMPSKPGKGAAKPKPAPAKPNNAKK